MSALVVGIADCKVSNDPEHVITTYALGSCIAVMVHDPVAKVGGLLHCMLPGPASDPRKLQESPFMFADSGVSALLQKLQSMGADKRRMRVTLAGGAQMFDDNGVFNIGKKNYTAVRGGLWKAGLMVTAESVGGTVSRTVRLDISTGQAWVRSSESSNEAANGGQTWRLMS